MLPASAADPETLPHFGLVSPECCREQLTCCQCTSAPYIHPSIPPSPHKGPPPAVLRMSAFALDVPPLLIHHQHLVIWQAVEDTERLVCFCPSSVSLAVLLIQSVFFCIYQGSCKICWQSTEKWNWSNWNICKWCRGISAKCANKHSDLNMQCHFYSGWQYWLPMLYQEKKKQMSVN